MLSSSSSVARDGRSGETPDVWPVMITFGICQSGESAGSGSGVVTSRRGAGDPSRPQRLDQRRLVDQLAAADIVDVGVRPHSRRALRRR